MEVKGDKKSNAGWSVEPMQNAKTQDNLVWVICWYVLLQCSSKCGKH